MTRQIPIRLFCFLLAQLNLLASLLSAHQVNKEYVEIIVPTKQGRIHGFNIDGTPVDLLNWPLQLSEAIKGSPCIDDVDNDGLNEIAVGALDWVHLFKTEGNANKVEWGRYRLNEKNNAVYDNRCFYDPQNPLEITSTQTWNDVIKVMDRDIVVKDGAVLTIRSKVKMPTDSKVIIERGGTLILDGGVLTSACGNIWQGVQVWGNNALSQYPFSNQGYLVMQNNAKIEDAKIAAAAIKYDDTDTDPHYAGGVIQAENSTFMNNVTGLYFHPYDNWVPELEEELENRSDFRDCNFVTNKQLNGLNLYPNAFVEMHGTEGIDFKGCEFVNARDIDIPPVSILGKGIVSTDAAYRVSFTCANEYEPCSDSNYTRFENLYRGIEATDARSNLFPIIEFCEFDNNYTGVYLAATPQASVTLCKFNIRKKYTDPEADDAFTGIYVNGGCDGFRIEENEFNNPETDPLAGTPYTVGVVINNSVTYYDVNNELYNNWFGNLNFGTLAMNNNRGNNFTGLQIKCNDYDNCETDIAVTPENCDGIAAKQGANSTNPEDMAGNLFYIPDPTPDGDFDDINNEGEHITYYYPSDAYGYNDRIKPIDYSENSVKLFRVIQYWTKNIGCPSHLEQGGGSIESLHTEMLATDQQIDSTENVLTLLIDGGDTEDMQDDVEYSTPPETMEIYNDLMGESPYLSDTVVSTAIEKEDVLPNAMMRDVMVANPNTAKSNKLMDKLDERYDPMPDYMKAQILEGRSILSIREETEADLAGFKAGKARAFNALMRHYRSDTLNPQASSDSILTMYQREDELWAKYALVFEYLNREDSTNAINTLDSIPVNYELSASQLSAHQVYEDYVEIINDLAAEGKTLFQADSADKAELYSLYDNSTENIHASLKNLLVTIDTLTYQEPYIFPDLLKSSEAYDDYLEIINTNQPAFLKVHPNPAIDYVIIEYMQEMEGPGNVYITDLNGKPITGYHISNAYDQKVLDTRNWKAGIYIATLKINDKMIESVKFSITN